MHLFIIRHAWAEDIDDAPGMLDHNRRLTDEGKKRFRKFVKRLVEVGLEAGVIATSPLVRCSQTADILSEILSGSPPVDVLPSLAPGASLDKELCAWTQAQFDAGRPAIWVGHAPDVGRLTAQLLGERHGYYQFKKGAVALLDATSPAAGCARLMWLHSDGTLED